LKVGAPFNPYRVFQGSFAPYWLLEHRGISAGAKLCYIRLLGFAGKDARCYPSLERLGASLGVSERQARDYVKELERSGFVVIEQRGLRKTNAYLFVWTAELERLSNAVPESGDNPDEPDGGTPPSSLPDRNDRSGQDRKQGSAPDRNSSSGQDRNSPAGPIGINSLEISSVESSSSSSVEVTNPRMTTSSNLLQKTQEEQRTQTISRWAEERRIQRLRLDRRLGPPDQEHLQQWSSILEQRAIAEPEIIFALLDSARIAADRSGEWRNWSFLTLQIQLAAERQPQRTTTLSGILEPERLVAEEDPACDWAIAKAKIRMHLGEIPFQNWFVRSRQVERHGAQITIAVPDEASRLFLETEYGNQTRTALAELGIRDVEWTVVTTACANKEIVPQVVAQTPCRLEERGER
jgi:Helix-turn-helix domain